MKRGGERTRLDIRPDKMRFKSAVRISCRKRAVAAAQRKRQAAAERKALKEVAIGSSGTLAEPKRLPKQRDAGVQATAAATQRSVGSDRPSSARSVAQSVASHRSGEASTVRSAVSQG